MALCNVTGTVYLPNGALAQMRTIVFRKVQRQIVADYLGVVLPDDVVTQTDVAGLIDIEILTGDYVCFAAGKDGGSFGPASVPDAATAAFSDIIGAAAVPDTPPVWYQQALEARDEAVAAADEITGMTVETGAAGTDATFVDGLLTVPRGSPPPVVVTATVPGSPVAGTFYVVTG